MMINMVLVFGGMDVSYARASGRPSKGISFAGGTVKPS